jgi:hypothetical protein
MIIFHDRSSWWFKPLSNVGDYSVRDYHTYNVQWYKVYIAMIDLSNTVDCITIALVGNSIHHLVEDINWKIYHKIDGSIQDITYNISYP